MQKSDLFRPNADAGEWCVLLLAVALALAVGGPIFPGIEDKSSWLSCLLAAFMSIHSLQVAYFVLGSTSPASFALSLVMRRRMAGPCDSAANLSGNAIKYFEQTGQLRSKIVLVGSLCFLAGFISAWWQVVIQGVMMFLYIHMLKHIFVAFPKTFTFGEGCLVVQGCLLYIARAVDVLISGKSDASTVIGSYSITVHLGLLSLCAFCSLPALTCLRWMRAPACWLTSGFVLLFCVTLPLLWRRLRRNPIFWIGERVLLYPNTLAFVVICLASTVAALLMVSHKTRSRIGATTVERKYFHVLVVIVFTSGVYLDVNFLYLSSCAALALQILSEYIRATHLDPLARMLDDAFGVFVDDKDQGVLVLSNIYLLVGSSVSMWLSADLDSADPAVLLSGVLSIGIGDSVASVVGSKLGKLRIGGTRKTLEGCLAAMISQMAFLLVVRHLLFGQLVIRPWLVVSICMVSVIEALTSQVDNLVLPLVLHILLLL